MQKVKNTKHWSQQINTGLGSTLLVVGKHKVRIRFPQLMNIVPKLYAKNIKNYSEIMHVKFARLCTGFVYRLVS